MNSQFALHTITTILADSMSDLKIKEAGKNIIFKAKIVPGSSKTAIGGLLDGMLKVKIATVAEKGKANQCLIKFLAEKLDVRRNDIAITSGQTNPIKQIEVSGISTETFLNKLKLKS